MFVLSLCTFSKSAPAAKKRTKSVITRRVCGRHNDHKCIGGPRPDPAAPDPLTGLRGYVRGKEREGENGEKEVRRQH